MVSPTLSSSEARLSQPHIFISVNISRCISIYLNIQYVMPCNVTRMAGCLATWSPTFSAHQKLVFLNLIYIYLNNISLSIYLVYLIDLICNALQCHMDGKQPGYMVSHILYSSKIHLSHIFISIYLSHYILIYPVYLNISYVMPCNVTRMAGCPAAWSPAFSAHQRLIFLNLSSSLAIFDRF